MRNIQQEEPKCWKGEISSPWQEKEIGLYEKKKRNHINLVKDYKRLIG